MYRSEIRQGDWVTNKTSGGRAEVVCVDNQKYRLIKECSSIELDFSYEDVHAVWKRLIPEKSEAPLPPWLQEGAEVLWGRQSYSAGIWRTEPVLVRIGRVLPNRGWFSTFNVEDRQLWFWNSETLAEQHCFTPLIPSRFKREAVV